MKKILLPIKNNIPYDSDFGAVYVCSLENLIPYIERQHEKLDDEDIAEIIDNLINK